MSSGPARARLDGHDGRLAAVLLAGYPVSWALGFGLVHHAAVALLMLGWLAANPPMRFQRGTGLLGLFVVVAAVSSVAVGSAPTLVLFALRLSWYASALVLWIYLARLQPDGAGGAVIGTGRRTVTRSLVVLWGAVVAGGWASVLAPRLSWPTPLGLVLPGGITDNDLIAQYVHPSVSETQVFAHLDLVLYRPAAPFAYTNGWGSAIALLTPFAVAALHDRRVGVARWLVLAGLAASLVPLAEALNRGSWLTLGIGLAWGGVRWALLHRDARPLVALGLVVVVGLAVASVTGIASSAADSLASRTGDSNETRSGLYLETIAESASSPLIGQGSTRPSTRNPDGPPLGTHGQLWAVLFAHGYLGATLYVGFFAFAFLLARPRDPVPHWAKVSLLIGLLQLPIYGHLPHQLFVMVAAAAMAQWSNLAGPVPAGRRSGAAPATGTGSR